MIGRPSPSASAREAKLSRWSCSGKFSSPFFDADGRRLPEPHEGGWLRDEGRLEQCGELKRSVRPVSAQGQMVSGGTNGR